MTSVQDLKDGESIRIVSGCGDSTMHVIKDGKTLYIRQDTTMKRVSDGDKDNQWVYDHFLKTEGELSDTLSILKDIRTTSHDWYSLLLCETLFNQYYGEDKH